MEAMRKEGGDKWLALFNAEREQQQQLCKVYFSQWLQMFSLSFHGDHVISAQSTQKAKEQIKQKENERKQFLGEVSSKISFNKAIATSTLKYWNINLVCNCGPLKTAWDINNKHIYKSSHDHLV